MCSAFNPDCGYDNSTTILIGDLYCPSTKCSGKLLPTQKDFSISGQKRLSMCAMRFCVPGAQYSSEDKKKSFFLSFGQGFYIFEESSNSSQDVIGDVYCRGKYWSN